MSTRRSAGGSASERHRCSRAAVLFSCFLVAAVIGGRVFADASLDSSSTGALKQLSVEELMNLEVTSVSKQPETLLQAPAAIQVITGDEIRRSGATSLPEALRLADNLEVAQENSHDWAISARGFNANLANKLLVLIDGRAVYTPLYGGVLWNVQDYLLEDIDRIEVISGPGGTLWGANAVNGVINIITKSAKDVQGLYAEAAGGKEIQGLAGARYGTEIAPDVYLRFYGKYTDHGDEVTEDGANANDAWHMGRGGFRLDADSSSVDKLTVQGDFYDGTEDYGAIGGAELSGGNVLGRWTRSLSSDSGMSLQTYFDHTYISQPFAASAPAPPYYSGFPAASLTDSLDTYDLDFQHHFTLGDRHRVIWGLGYRATHEVDEDLSVVQFAPPALDQNLYSGFLQDEVMLAETVHFTVGSKIEHNDYTGFEVEPNIRLQYNVAPRQLLWAAISRAVRTPSRYDRDLGVVSGLSDAPPPYQFPAYYLKGNPDFRSETVIAYESGYRAEFGSKLSGSLSLFYNDYNNLRSTSTTPTTAYYPFPYPVTFDNDLEGETHGFELSMTYQVLDGWRLRGGYDLLIEHIHVKPGQEDATNATNETADPEQQWSVRSSLDLPRKVQLDTALRWVDQFHINNGPTGGSVVGIVPSYFELDTRLAWHATDRLELSLVGQNLLHPYHVEYGFPSPAREAIERTVFAKFAWTY
jgi:iron complex outermembrane receptor protein